MTCRHCGAMDRPARVRRTAKAFDLRDQLVIALALYAAVLTGIVL